MIKCETFWTTGFRFKYSVTALYFKKKDVTHNFWTKFGDSDCSGAGSEPCQGSKRFEAGTVHYCSFPSVRNTKLPDEPGKSITLLPRRCAGTFGYTRICPTHVLARTLRVVFYYCYRQNNKSNSLQNPLTLNDAGFLEVFFSEKWSLSYQISFQMKI